MESYAVAMVWNVWQGLPATGAGWARRALPGVPRARRRPRVGTRIGWPSRQQRFNTCFEPSVLEFHECVDVASNI
jgi:hypothetical protein